jgi:hypothetical protein
LITGYLKINPEAKAPELVLCTRIFCGPCFFAQNFYHGVIDLAFAQSDYHDRHRNTNFAQ